MEINPIISEKRFKRLSSAKTLDSFFSPMVLVILKYGTTVMNAILISLVLGLVLIVYRLYKKQTSMYAFLGILIISIMAYYFLSIEVWDEFFLTNMFTTYLGMFFIFISLLFRRPLAAYVAHILTGRPLQWFWEKDKKRVYLEVTILWAVFFIFRLVMLFILGSTGDYPDLPWYSVLLSLPAMMVILILTYLYGVMRLGTIEES